VQEPSLRRLCCVQPETRKSFDAAMGRHLTALAGYSSFCDRWEARRLHNVETIAGRGSVDGLTQICQQAGLGDEPRKVFDEIAAIIQVDLVLPTRKGITIRKRCVSKPTEHQNILLQKLRLQLTTTTKIQ
jgi:hypothetical protein